MQKKPVLKQKSCQKIQFLLKRDFERGGVWKDFGRKMRASKNKKRPTNLWGVLVLGDDLLSHL